MNRTRALGFVLFLAFVALAGCTSAFGPSPANQDALTQNESYDWDTDVNASINITGGSYEAVYRVDNRSEFVGQRRDRLQVVGGAEGVEADHPLHLEARLAGVPVPHDDPVGQATGQGGEPPWT